MKLKIVSSVIMFIGAAFMIAYGMCMYFVNTLLVADVGLTVSICSLYAAVICGYNLIVGGILVLVDKSNTYGFIMALICGIIAFAIIIPDCFTYAATDGFSIFGINKHLKNALLATRIIVTALIIVPLIVMPKFRGAVYGVTAFFSLLTALFFGYSAMQKGLGWSFAAPHFILGVLGATIVSVGGGASVKNKEYSLSLLLIALLVIAGQFIMACAMCTKLNGVIIMILALSGLIMSIVGGVLVADSNESGFVIIAFGFILLIGWSLFTLLLVSKAIGIGLICVMVSIILSAAAALKSRAQNKT